MATHSVTITVLGTGAIGKSASIIQFVESRFIPKYDPTIANTFRKTVIVGEQPIVVNVNDTAGTAQMEALNDTEYKSSDGFIVMYSTTDKSSFLQVEQIVQKIHMCRGFSTADFDKDDIPIILVGNKVDLTDFREVTTGEGEKLSEKFQAFKFFETSAKTKLNVNEAFEACCEAAYGWAKVNKAPPPKDSGGWHCALF